MNHVNACVPVSLACQRPHTFAFAYKVVMSDRAEDKRLHTPDLHVDIKTRNRQPVNSSAS